MILLPWDSDFFGFKVARLSEEDVRGDLDAAVALLRAQDVRLAYLDLAHGDAELRERAFAAGANFINQRTLLGRGLGDAPDGSAAVSPTGNLVAPEDEKRLVELAWASAEQSRFRLDPRLPPESWRRLYRTWMERSLSGEMADAVLIHRHEGRIGGMITVRRAEDAGEIGLFAVHGEARGRGIGSALLAGALGWFAGAGCREARVVTQGENSAALSAYRRAGFDQIRLTDVYHLWIERA
jgi:dTDP-4-amino-4,6-dideoxy-D-galactose acyltransferase